eukprot:12495942-Alexandrium_andersonii.AAC.1
MRSTSPLRAPEGPACARAGQGSASASRLPTNVHQALQTACSGLQRCAARPPQAGLPPPGPPKEKGTSGARSGD